jgi:hypothetical protein
VLDGVVTIFRMLIKVYRMCNVFDMFDTERMVSVYFMYLDVRILTC